MHTLIGHGGAGVPVSMEGEQKPIVIVDESRLNFVFHGVGLAAELGAHVGNLHRLAVFVLSLIGDLAGFWLPLPRVSKFEESGDFPVPGVTDSLDLPIRIETIGFGDLLENWRPGLRPGGCSKNNKDQHHESHTDHRYTARI